MKRFSNAQKKVDATQAALAANKDQQKDIGRDFTFAANEALKHDPAPSRESQVAEDLTERALLATGNPPADTAAKMRQMAADLVSTNAETIARGEKELADKDAALAKAQEKAGALESKLSTAEEKLKAVSQQNAELASKWVRLRHICEWLIGGVVFLVVLWLASIIVPMFFPEVSGPMAALHGVVSAVETIRNGLKASHPEIAQQVDNTLSVAMPPNSRAAAAIDQVKTRLGL